MPTYVKEVVDSITGEVTRTEKQFWIKGKGKPFIKLFLQDVHFIVGLPSGYYHITFELLSKMNYDNEVVLNSTIKREIAINCGFSFSYVHQAITNLVEKQILIRKDKGVYWFNPLIFARKNDGGVKEIVLKMSYSESGKKLFAEVIEEINKEQQPKIEKVAE